MLTHKELSIQRVGLQYVLSLVNRLQRAVNESGLTTNYSASSSTGGQVGAIVEHCLANALQTYLPDFQTLINLRAR